MTTLDFHGSFLIFEIDYERKPPRTSSDSRQNHHNRARIQIDCRCRITDPKGQSADYYLGESCKTERVGVTREVGLFIQPNADFRAVFSQEWLVIFKSWDKNDKGVMLVPASLGPQPERQVVRIQDAFYSHRIDLRPVEGRILSGVDEIIQAADKGMPLAARTEYGVAGYRVILDYPVFTLNTSERHQCYQTDTGPVIYPELDRPHERVPDTFRLAFCAFNQPDWIEFVVQKPTPVGHGISVNHYSETVQIERCQNTIIAVE